MSGSKQYLDLAWRERGNYLGPRPTAVLLAVVRLSGLRRSVTVRDVADVVGKQVGQILHDDLRDLRRRGLVDWVDHASGTLHPTCEVVVPEWT